LNLLHYFRRPVAVPPAGNLSVICLAGRSVSLGDQTAVHSDLDYDLLIGTGTLRGIGPGVRTGSPDRIELLVKVTLHQKFREIPTVTPFLLHCQPEGDGISGCSLGLRSVSTEDFTLVVRPDPGSPRMRVEFGWVAAGRLAPLQSAKIFPFTPVTHDH
jgi:hypothetical protein